MSNGLAPYTSVTRTSHDRLGTADMVVAGLGAMLGAGLFAGLAPASALVGNWLPLGVVLAAVLALLTSCTTGDQAGVFPGPGGGYRYTREQLGRWPGRTAGGLYLVGRGAAAAALAGCFGAYVSPDRPVLPALGLLVVAVAADAIGVRLSRRLIRVSTVFVLVVLALVVAACFAIPAPPPVGVALPADTPGLNRPGDLLPATGVLFFGFLGFERVTAPDGAGPSSPRRLRIVIPVLLAVALGTYLLVGSAVLRQLGPMRLALSTAPLRDALDAADASMVDPLVTIAAMVTTAVGLLVVLGGGQRTAEAMAGKGDLPAMGMAARVLIGGGAALGVLFAGPGQAIELAATCALFYYAFSNASARLLSRDERSWPTRVACFGLGLAVLIAMSMPVADLVTVLAVALLAGVAGPLVARVGHARR
jgi:basic amino acid/polyamine antiporter, APA family